MTKPLYSPFAPPPVPSPDGDTGLLPAPPATSWANVMVIMGPAKVAGRLREASMMEDLLRRLVREYGHRAGPRDQLIDPSQQPNADIAQAMRLFHAWYGEYPR